MATISEMRRLALINLLLLAIVAGLAALVWWPQATPGPSPQTTTPLVKISKQAVDRLQVTRGAHHVALARRDGRWRLTAPVEASADPAHLAVLLPLAGADPLRRVADNIPDRVTGLGDRAIVVRYDDQPPIRIGQPGPMPDSYYVATTHGHFLVAIPHLGVLHWQWFDWLNRALVPPSKRLSRIVLPNFTIVSGRDGAWQAKPAGQRSPAAAAATAQAWAGVKALRLLPADPKRARTGRITLDFRDGSQRIFDVVEDDPNLVLRDPRLGVDYQLAGNRIGPLLKLRHPGL